MDLVRKARFIYDSCLLIGLFKKKLSPVTVHILNEIHYFIHSLGQDLEETLRFRNLVTFEEEENQWILQKF